MPANFLFKLFVLRHFGVGAVLVLDNFFIEEKIQSSDNQSFNFLHVKTLEKPSIILLFKSILLPLQGFCRHVTANIKNYS